MFQEELGLIEDGSQTLVDALVAAITSLGGSIRLSTPARRIVTADGKVAGVETDKGFTGADCVISTVPTPFVAGLVPDLPVDWRKKYEQIRNIGVCCLVFKLKRSLS